MQKKICGGLWAGVTLINRQVLLILSGDAIMHVGQGSGEIQNTVCRRWLLALPASRRQADKISEIVFCICKLKNTTTHPNSNQESPNAYFLLQVTPAIENILHLHPIPNSHTSKTSKTSREIVEGST